TTRRGRRSDPAPRARLRGARRGARRARSGARRVRRRGDQQALRRRRRSPRRVSALVPPHPVPVPRVPQRARLQDARRRERRPDGRHLGGEVLRHVPQRRDRLERGALRSLPFRQARPAEPRLRRPPDHGAWAMVSRFLPTLWVAAFLAFGGCESAPREPARYSSLTPGPVIRGGLLGVAGPFTPLRGPVAVAAMGPDVYIADTGLGMLLRADQVANRLTPFGPRGVQPVTRLAAAVDGSLYVLEPAGRRLQRFARDGRLLQTFPVDPTIASLRDLALDPTRGRILGADALNRQLVAFRPLGTSSELLPLHGEPRYQITSFDALAVAPEALYALDARCRCIARLAFDGQV